MPDIVKSWLDKWGWAMLAALVSVAISTGWHQAKVAQLERDIEELRADKKAALKLDSEVSQRLARIETRLENWDRVLMRIEARDRRTEVMP